MGINNIHHGGMDMRLRDFREGLGSTEEIPGMETTPAPAADAIAPVLIRGIVAGMIVSADNSLLNLAEKYNLHQIYRLLRTFQKLLISSFLFFLGVLPSVLSFLSLLFHTYAFNFTSPKSDDYAPPPSSSAAGADAGVARALAQLLVILNDIPVSSRKYELVRSLAELLIDENHRQGFESLQELNRHVLSAAFARSLGRLESAASEMDPSGRFSRCGSGIGLADFGLGRVFRVVRGAGEVFWGRFMSRAGGRCEYSAEKMAAELLWLAQKMASCGIAEEAVCRWASASNVASLGLSAEPRLQGSLIKISGTLAPLVHVDCIFRPRLTLSTGWGGPHRIRMCLAH